MMEHHQIRIPDPVSDSRPRKLLFQIMHDVRKNYVEEPNVDLRTLNNVSMNLARDVFMRKGPQPVISSAPSSSQIQDRDQLLYGARSSNPAAPRPEPTSRIQHTSESAPHQLPGLVPIPKPGKLEEAVADNPIDVAETARRLAGRDDDLLLAKILRNPPPVVCSPAPQVSAANEQTHQPVLAHAPAHARDREHEHFSNQNETDTQQVQQEGRGYSSLLQSAPQSIISDRYVIVNGFDRYWQQSPLRYQYTVLVGTGSVDPLNKSLQTSYKNIHSMQITRLVIPMEIVPRTTFKGIDHTIPIGTCSGNTGKTVKGVYRHAASLSFPYVMISIDGFTDIYDGTNQAARQAFCQMVYSNSYKAPNGRGFVIMEPMQNEKKIFSPTPLATLGRLNVSILRPSGDLFNNSTDDQMIQEIRYETFNRQYLRIVLIKYFDMNDFFVGDSVVVQDYASTQALVRPGLAWTPDPTASYEALNTYINRSEGHEIIELGLANDSGFFQSFCIMAPGKLDTSIGSIVLDAPAMAAVMEMSVSTTPCPSVPFGGALLNMSLQNVMTFKLGVLNPGAPAAFPV